MKKRMLSALLTLCMVLTMAPTVAFAAPEGDPAEPSGKTIYVDPDYSGAETDVYFINWDTAIKAATECDESSVTIKVLESCALDKSISVPEGKKFTITADAADNITITDKERHGLRPNGSLNMENLTFITNGQIALNGTAAGPLGREVTFTNVTLRMDGNMYPFHPTDGYYCNAIFADTPALFVFDGCDVEIKNYPSTGAAIRWNGKNNDRGYGVEIKNGTKFVAEGNYGGFVGTLDMLIDNSELQVINNRGYGSNGTFYTIQNGSKVLFDGNVDWGISANELKMTTNSTLTATNNGRSGVWARAINVDSTCTLTVEGNGYDFASNMSGFESSGSFGGSTGAASNAGITYWGKKNVPSTIEAGAKVTIRNNAGSGISALQGNVCNLTIGSATITNNGLGNENGENPAIYGGGIFSIGTIALGPDVVLYNNHASKAGDDIYSTKTITFPATGSNWALDGAPDCNGESGHDIDGWYHDGKYEGETSARWEAHAATMASNFIYDLKMDTNVKEVTGVTALKAAHGVVPLGSKWETSKSKTATNLSNYESQVTLSLPAAEEQLVSDVVFVLDKSTSTTVETEMLQMLENLKNQVAETGAKVKVGVVIFNKEANRVLELTELKDENMATIKAAIETTIKSGTNTHAGLLAGKAMLDADTEVAANRKYMVFVSDGITYMYNQNPTAIGLQNGDKTNVFAGPDNWNTKYGTNDGSEDWNTWINTIRTQIEADGATYDYPYGENYENYISFDDRTNHAMSIDKALYLTNQVYQEAVSAGYNCYAMTAETGAKYAWGPSFMEYLAGGQEVTFESIQNDIYYLLDKGSYIKDYMGYVADDYDFDFVNDASKLSMKVGGTKYVAHDLGNNVYGFAPDTAVEPVTSFDYELTYHPGDGANEHFVWKTNVPVSNFERVQLAYTVQLTNPQEADGIYGQYDADGSKGYDGLYTNNSATLYPIDSNGYPHDPEYFAKPTVSYTVGGGGSTSGGGGYQPPAELNTEDHYAYIIGYPKDYRTGEPTDDKSLWPVEPQGQITRAEVATIFFRMLTDEARSEHWAQTNPYSDVAAEAWYNNAISTLTNMDIISGDPRGTFRPNDPITRAEFTKIAVGFFEETGDYVDGTFSDVSANAWYADFIDAAVELGLIEGYPDGTVRPNATITRAEACTIVNRTLNRVPDEDHLLPVSEMRVWPDNNPGTWYYEQMQEATNSHDYEWITVDGEEVENWTGKLEDRVWEELEREWSDANSAPGGEVMD